MGLISCLEHLETGNEKLDGFINGAFIGFILSAILPMFIIIGAGYLLALVVLIGCGAIIPENIVGVIYSIYFIFWLVIALLVQGIYLASGFWLIGVPLCMISVGIVGAIWNHGETIAFTVRDMKKMAKKVIWFQKENENGENSV